MTAEWGDVLGPAIRQQAAMVLEEIAREKQQVDALASALITGTISTEAACAFAAACESLVNECVCVCVAKMCVRAPSQLVCLRLVWMRLCRRLV